MPILALLPHAGLLLMVLVQTRPAQQTEKTFVSRTCHVAFSYPVDWEVVPDTSDPRSACSFSARPHDWRRRLVASDSVDLSTISLDIAAQGVWDRVSESAFQRRGAGWVVLGRMGDLEQKADTISGPGWKGVRGTASQGCYHVEGGYAGLCDQPTALAGTGSRSIVIVGGPQSEHTLDRILKTLRFPL